MKLDDIKAELPPIYHLVQLETDDRTLDPAQPVQLMPHDDQIVFVRTFGRCSSAGIFYGRVRWPVRVHGITYEIIVYGGAGMPGVTARYHHPFKRPVEFDGDRLTREDGMDPLVEYLNALADLPKLPYNWKYIQFVG